MTPREYASYRVATATYNIKTRAVLAAAMDGARAATLRAGMDGASPLLAHEFERSGLNTRQLSALVATALVELARAWYTCEPAGEPFVRGARSAVTIVRHLVASLPEHPSRSDLDSLATLLDAIVEEPEPAASR